MEKQYTPSLSLCEALSELDRLYEDTFISLGQDKLLQSQLADTMFLDNKRTELAVGHLIEINKNNPEFKKLNAIENLADLYRYSRKTNSIILEWYCAKHKNLFLQRLGDRARSVAAGICCPAGVARSTSAPEILIYNYLQQLLPKYTITKNDRTVLKTTIKNKEVAKELDIYLAEAKIGIEYDGEYYHKDTVEVEDDEFKDSLCINSPNIKLLIRVREAGLEESKYKVADSNIIKLVYVPKGINNSTAELTKCLEQIKQLCIQSKCITEDDFKPIVVSEENNYSCLKSYLDILGRTDSTEINLSAYFPEIAKAYDAAGDSNGLKSSNIQPWTTSIVSLKCPKCGKIWLTPLVKVTKNARAKDPYATNQDADKSAWCPECRKLWNMANRTNYYFRVYDINNPNKTADICDMNTLINLIDPTGNTTRDLITGRFKRGDGKKIQYHNLIISKIPATTDQIFEVAKNEEPWPEELTINYNPVIKDNIDYED